MLPRQIYDQPALEVARLMLGAILVRVENGQRISGMILETEAYGHEEDLACHCRYGLTPRTGVMYGPPGHAYVYFTYGMHWMLNFVVEGEGAPAAVLIRAVQPLEGLDTIAARRVGVAPEHWTDGPAKICQAFGIDKRQNSADLCTPEAGLWVEAGEPIPGERVTTGPRVGLNKTPEPWKSLPWRFRVV